MLSIARCRCRTAIRRIGLGTTRRFSNPARPMSFWPTTPNGYASGGQNPAFPLTPWSSIFPCSETRMRWKQPSPGIAPAARSAARSARSGCRRYTSGAMPTTPSGGSPPRARLISSPHPTALKCSRASAFLPRTRRRIASARYWFSPLRPIRSDGSAAPALRARICSRRLRHLGHPLPRRRLQAWPGFHPRQPRDEIVVRRDQRRPFRREAEEAEVRRDQQVRERYRFAGEEGLPAQKPRQFFEYRARLRHRGFDRGLIGGKPHHPRPDHTIEDDDIGDALEQVPVIDIHHLIHPRRSLRLSGRERRVRQHPVEIAQDGLGLVKQEAAVFEHRHPAEGMTGEVFGRAQRARRHRRKPPGCALLFQRRQHGTSERTAGNGVHDEFRHDDLLHSLLLFKRGCSKAIQLVLRSASCTNLSIRPGQPPSTSLRIDAPASAPMVSNLWCSSSTRVASGPSALKRTSTSDFIAASGFHCALICQSITRRCGGSPRVIVATLG